MGSAAGSARDTWQKTDWPAVLQNLRLGSKWAKQAASGHRKVADAKNAAGALKGEKAPHAYFPKYWLPPGGAMLSLGNGLGASARTRSCRKMALASIPAADRIGRATVSEQRPKQDMS
jgi:hypothetical protein